MKTAQLILELYNKKTQLENDILVKQAYYKVITKFMEESMCSKNSSVSVHLWSVDLFEDDSILNDIKKQLTIWKDLSELLQNEGFEVISFRRDENEIDFCVQPK